MTEEEARNKLQELGEAYAGVTLRMSTRRTIVVHANPIDGKENNRAKYIQNRFRIKFIDLEDTTEKSLADIHKKIGLRCISLSSDFDVVMKYVEDTIRFDYAEIYIRSSFIIFILPSNPPLTITISYRLDKNKQINIMNNMSARNISMGTSFIELQEKLYAKTPEEKSVETN